MSQKTCKNTEELERMSCGRTARRRDASSEGARRAASLKHVLGQILILEEWLNLLSNVFDSDFNLGPLRLICGGEAVLVHDALDHGVETTSADVFKGTIRLE